MITTLELSDAARGHLAALLAGDARAGIIVDTLAPGDVDAISAHPGLTWTLLCEQPDRDAALRIMEHRIQGAFVRGEDALVRAELDGPELVRDSLSNRAVEELAMRAVTALAWDDPDGARRLHARLCSRDRSQAMVQVYNTCQAVLAVAPLWKELESERSIPRPLERFVRLQWVASPAVLGELIAALRRDMTARSDVYLDTFDALTERYQLLLLYIVGLTERFISRGGPSLGELGQEEQSRLGARLGEIDASIFGVWTRRGMYGRQVRRPLAAYLAESGIPTACVVSWLLANRKAVKRIKAFDVAIDADAALAAIARLGRMTRLHADIPG